MANPKYRKLTVADVGQEAWDAYEEVRTIYQALKAAKAKAERLATGRLPDLPDDVAYVFTYTYGWSIFLGEPKAEATTAKPKVNLSDWITSQAANGYQS